MVRRVLAFMNREIRGLHEAAYLLAFFALFSQVLALVRDRTFAHFFGTSALLDAYFAAFKIPDFLFVFLTLFVSSFAIIPLIAKRGGAEHPDSRSLIGSVLVTFGVMSVVFSTGLFFLMPFLVPFFFPGFATATVETVVVLSQIMLLQPFLLGLSSIVVSVVQSSRRFVLYALAPIFYNVGIIVGVLFLYPAYGVWGLGWGVVLGAALHFLIQTVPLFIHNRLWIPLFRFSFFSDTYEVLRASFPRVLALSANQSLLIGIMSTASVASVGSVAAVSFAFNLQSMPLSIIAVSYTAALFPSLALLFSKGEHALFISEVWASVRHIIFWTAPAIVLIIVLRAHIVRVVLGSGEFSWDATRLTAAVLAAFSISLIAQALMMVFSRAYYAAHKEIVPIVLNVGTAVVAGLFVFVSFMWFGESLTGRYFIEHLFRVDGIAGSSMVVVALAYSLIMIGGATYFAYVFSRDFGFEKSVFHTLWCAFSASIIGGFVAYLILQVVGPLLPTDTFVGILTQGAVAGVGGFSAWALTLFFLKNKEFFEVCTLVSHRVRSMFV